MAAAFSKMYCSSRSTACFDSERDLTGASMLYLDIACALLKETSAAKDDTERGYRSDAADRTVLDRGLKGKYCRPGVDAAIWIVTNLQLSPFTISSVDAFAAKTLTAAGCRSSCDRGRIRYLLI